MPIVTSFSHGVDFFFWTFRNWVIKTEAQFAFPSLSKHLIHV